jgi:hypothetical protein
MDEVTRVAVVPELAPEPERSAWQERAVAVAGFVLLAFVQVCVAAMSWAGLVGFAHDELKLSHGSQYMVPISLDGASMAAAFLALRSVIRGDSAAGPRLMVAAFTGASAWFNYHHADQHLDANAALFFSGMSVAAVAMFDLVLRQVRRHRLRRIGAVESPLARFRLLRWARFPRETFAAWSVALRRGYSVPADALSVVWDVRAAEDDANRIHDMDSLDGLTKSEAARWALLATGGKVPAAMQLLESKGVTIDRSYAYDINRQLKAERALSAG